MYIEDLVLNNHQRLICHETQPNLFGQHELIVTLFLTLIYFILYLLFLDVTRMPRSPRVIKLLASSTNKPSRVNSILIGYPILLPYLSKKKNLVTYY